MCATVAGSEPGFESDRKYLEYVYEKTTRTVDASFKCRGAV